MLASDVLEHYATRTGQPVKSSRGGRPSPDVLRIAEAVHEHPELGCAAIDDSDVR